MGLSLPRRLDGTQVFHGADAPSDSLGQDGDTWIRSDGVVYAKAAGVWAPRLSVEFRDEVPVVSAKRFGLVDGLSDTVTRNKIEDAIEGAVSAGVKLLIPWNTVGDAAWQIDGALPVEAASTLIDVAGQIEQTTWGEPVFDVLYGADGTEIYFPRGLISSQTRDFDDAGGSTSFRGDQAFLYSAGVYCCADHVKVKGYVEGFIAGAVASPWNGSAINARRGVGNSFDLITDQVDFGLLAMAQQGVEFLMRGSYELATDSPHPSHLVYFSDNASALTSRGIIGRGFAWDGTDGHAFQFKGVEGGVVSVASRNCEGLLSLRGNPGLHVASFEALADVPPSTGTLYMQDGGTHGLSAGTTFGNGRLQLASPGRALRAAGDRTTFGKTLIEVAENDTGDDYYVWSGDGDRIDLGKLKIVNAGTGGRRAVYVEDGTGTILRDPEMRGVKCAVVVAAAATDTVLDIDPRKITFGSANVGRVVDSGTDTIRRDVGREHVMSGWVTASNQTVVLGKLPAPIHVHGVEMYVHEAFNSDGTDNLALGHGASNDYFAANTDVSTTGDKTPTAGTGAKYRSSTQASQTAVTARYFNGGSEPTTGKALVKLRFSFVDSAP